MSAPCPHAVDDILYLSPSRSIGRDVSVFCHFVRIIQRTCLVSTVDLMHVVFLWCRVAPWLRAPVKAQVCNTPTRALFTINKQTRSRAHAWPERGCPLQSAAFTTAGDSISQELLLFCRIFSLTFFQGFSRVMIRPAFRVEMFCKRSRVESGCVTTCSRLIYLRGFQKLRVGSGYPGPARPVGINPTQPDPR